MKTTLVIGALAAMVGVGSAGYLLLADDDDEVAGGRERSGSKAKRSSSREPAREDRADWAMEDRVAELEVEVDQLRRQLRAVQLRSGVVAGFGGSADADAELADPAITDSVRTLMAEEREREREQELERRRERSKERSDELLDELGSKAGINDDQREKIGTLWADERDRTFALMNEARGEDRDFREVREQTRALRRSTDEQAKSLLSDEQYAVYEELRPRGVGGNRGGRGPGPSDPKGGGDGPDGDG